MLNLYLLKMNVLNYDAKRIAKVGPPHLRGLRYATDHPPAPS